MPGRQPRAADRPRGRAVLTRADWVAAALEVLAEGGLEGVAVEPLAARLRTTKGSFYHHFDNRDALIRAALEQWRRSETDEPIRLLSLIRDPAERLRTLVAHAILHQQGGLLAATLSAAADHPLVRPVLQQVTAQRLRFIADAYAELGFPRPEAERRALLIYGAYVGFFHLMRAAPDPVMPEGELHRYVDDVVEALVPGPRG